MAHEKTDRAAEKAAESDDAQAKVAHTTSTGLVWIEDAVYALTALLLAIGALLVVTQAVYELATDAPHGVKDAIENALDSLLVVFILVELLAAVRVAIAEHELVAEPFLLVGVLAAIKELVVLSTFRIEDTKASEAAIKVGVLAGVILVLAAATWILRRREREPKETEAE